MKKIVTCLFILSFVCSCNKNNAALGGSEGVPLGKNTLSATDVNYNQKTDTILVKVNRMQVNPNAYQVSVGDSVQVHYNPAADSMGNIHKNNLLISYNGGKIVVKQFDCHCIVDYFFIVQ